MTTAEHQTLVELWHALAKARSCYDPRLLASAESALVRWYEPRLVGRATVERAPEPARQRVARDDLVHLIRTWQGTDPDAFVTTLLRDIRLHLSDPEAALAAGSSSAPATLRQLMSAPAVTVHGWTPIADAVRILVDNGFTATPVVDDRGALVGIISEADLLRATMPGGGGGEPGAATVADVMTTEVESLPPTATPAAAAELMLRDHRRSVPIQQRGRVVGVVTRRDLLRAATASAGS